MTRILGGLERALMAVAGAGLVAMSLVLVVQVFMRYVVGSPTIWSEEFATLCFVWTVMAAIPVAVRRHEHIAVEFVVNRLRGRARTTVRQLALVLTAGTFALVGVVSLPLVSAGSRQLMTGLSIATGLEITLLAMYLAVPVGCLLAAVFTVGRIIAVARGTDTAPGDSESLNPTDATVATTPAGDAPASAPAPRTDKEV